MDFRAVKLPDPKKLITKKTFSVPVSKLKSGVKVEELGVFVNGLDGCFGYVHEGTDGVVIFIPGATVHDLYTDFEI